MLQEAAGLAETELREILCRLRMTAYEGNDSDRRLKNGNYEIAGGPQGSTLWRFRPTWALTVLLRESEA